MKFFIRFAIYLFVTIGYLSSNAGSYDDFFRALGVDDDRTVAALLQRGFDPNTPNPQGEHPLFLALRVPAPKVLRLLLAQPGVRADARNAHDETPLMLAALKGQVSVVAALIDRDADVNKPGWTPLHYAASGGQVEVIRLLLEHDAYIDAASPNGTTPLMMAAMYGTPAAVKVLLEAGADPLAKNNLGLTALDFAQRGNRPDAEKLIEAFAAGASAQAGAQSPPAHGAPDAVPAPAPPSEEPPVLTWRRFLP